jgi:hypothetical protein
VHGAHPEDEEELRDIDDELLNTDSELPSRTDELLNNDEELVKKVEELRSMLLELEFKKVPVFSHRNAVSG